MAAKMSNRDRIAQKAAEAAATAKEKSEAAKSSERAVAAPRKSAAAKGSGGKSRAKSTARGSGRIKIVWRVCNPAGVEVKSFPYAQEAEARAEAERMTTELGRTHFVRRDEVPLSS